MPQPVADFPLRIRRAAASSDPMNASPCRRWPAPLLGALLCLALGTLSGVLFSGSIADWYQTLNHPPGTPPPWVFGPVWSLLYLAMGISAGLLWNDRNRRALSVFAIQFVLNLAWTPVFFGAHRIGWAMAVIIALWVAIATTMILARRSSRTAALLLLPYLVWVSYASYLNGGYLILNR